MNAKEFLEQATVLNEKINMDFLHRQKLKELLEQISGGSVALHERVQGGQLPDSPASKLVDKIIDLDRLIEQELAEYDVILEEIKKAIISCDSQDEIFILKGHYVEQKSLIVLGEERGYSKTKAYRIHMDALKKIQAYLKIPDIHDRLRLKGIL